MTRTAPLAVAADYADALTTARRAKSVLFLLLLLLVIAQVTVFMLLRYDVLKMRAADPGETYGSDNAILVHEIVRYAVPATAFLGIVLAIVMSVVLLLLAKIMLVGRLIGVSHVVSAFIWSVLLLAVMFPWQAFLISDPDYRAKSASETLTPPQPAFKVPGVLYTFEELQKDYKFSNEPMQNAVLKWARYAGAPALALIFLLLVQMKSSRGLKFALGEADLPVDVGTPTM